MKKRWNNSTTFEKIMIVIGITFGSPILACFGLVILALFFVSSVMSAFDFLFGREDSKND